MFMITGALDVEDGNGGTAWNRSSNHVAAIARPPAPRCSMSRVSVSPHRVSTAPACVRSPPRSASTPALVSRYFGSEKRLYAEAMHMEIPTGVAADPHRPVVSIADALLHDVVYQDWSQYGGEHSLPAMLRSAGHDDVRDQLRTQLCDGYLREFADRLDGPDPELRAELIGALLIGRGVLRSVIGTPAVSAAPFDRTRVLVGRMVNALT